ncbi:hypothetical protein ACN47E_010166 [Coniothyrium glycines]
MAKRKRGSGNGNGNGDSSINANGNGDDESVDVGLGASGSATAPAVDGDGEGWTVVGSHKRRRQERNTIAASHGSTPPNAQRSPPSHGHHHDASPRADCRRRAHDAGPYGPPQDEPTNPFASHDARHTFRASVGDNPFAVRTPAPQPLQEEHLTREQRKKERKLQRSYPAIEHSHHARLQSHVKLVDLQALLLYLLADGNAPQWVSVRSRSNIQQVVMLLVPGLQLGMFNGEIALQDESSPVEAQSPIAMTSSLHSVKPERLTISPDDFYPAELRPDRLPGPLKPLAEIFEHVWPTKAPGEHRNNQYIKVHSPIHTMLTSQIPKTQEEKQLKRSGNHKGPIPQNAKHWENKRTRITEYLATLADLQENDYVPHPAMFATSESKAAALKERELHKQTLDDGWVDTRVDNLEQGDVSEADIDHGSITAGRHVLSIDCEMCKSDDDQLVLTRISLLSWDGSVVLDKLVKPDVPIKDYLTQWSGITAEMLQSVTTTLRDIQMELLKLLTPRTILMGHSLNSDLNALKMTHPFLIDTGILYPHPRGHPYKQSLKWLAQKFLRREVQKGSKGHDSVEDARTCLDLVKQKCEKGPRWGSGETNTESLFKRLGRCARPKSSQVYRSGAVIDWGEPSRGYGAQAQLSIGCQSDAQVVEAIARTLAGEEPTKEGLTGSVDFVWGRLRELELARGWWDDAKTADVEAIRVKALKTMGLPLDENEREMEVTGSALGDAVARTVDRIVQIYDALPRCTAFIVYSGSGDPREIRRLQSMQQQYRREYATKNWDSLSVKWTDTEVQALSEACQTARNGTSFVAVK